MRSRGCIKLVCRAYLLCRLAAETTAVRRGGRLIETKQDYETNTTSHEAMSFVIQEELYIRDCTYGVQLKKAGLFYIFLL